MTAMLRRRGGRSSTQLHHYTECGLDDVYLLSGHDVHATPYGEGVSIHDVDGLHRAIGRWLALEKKSLSGKEIRFLRKELGLTQERLADRLGTTCQTLARWEKDKVPIPGPADILLRVIYLSEMFGRADTKLGLRLRALEGAAGEVTFTSRDGKWQLLPRAA